MSRSVPVTYVDLPSPSEKVAQAIHAFKMKGLRNGSSIRYSSSALEIVKRYSLMGIPFLRGAWSHVVFHLF